MKNSTILMTIIAIVFSLSNTFAQTTIIKSGLISNAIGIEVEHNILKSRYSIITGLSYSESFGHFRKSMVFEEKNHVYRITENYKINSAVRIYLAPLKNGMNFYIQPQVIYVKTTGFEKQIPGDIWGSLNNLFYLFSFDKKKYIKTNTKRYKEKKIDQDKILGSISTGFMVKKNRFTFDLGIGYQIGKINPQTVPLVGDLKFGYAF